MADGTVDVKALRAAAGISHADEKRIAVALSPPVAWPTLALAVILPAALLGVVWLGVARVLPLWVCTPILAIVSYAHYTLVHEAIHGNVVSKPKSLAWINTVVGWIGSLGMGAGWPALQRTHLLHHSHTNTERDPDIAVKGTFGRLLLKWLVTLPMSLLPIFAIRFINPEGYKRLSGILSPAEVAQTSAVTLLTWALLIASIATGRALDWLLLWFLPTRLGIL
ncbi:MAG TPA: fatty acid desaturase, partial [Caulobacteraceae bacterium]|nr:fatty acid desaturase [Caulobacteraceae bacterium]